MSTPVSDPDPHTRGRQTADEPEDGTGSERTHVDEHNGSRPTAFDPGGWATRLEALQADVRDYKIRRDTWTLMLSAIAALALVVSAIGLAEGWGDDTSTAMPAGAQQVFDIELGEFYVSPSSIEVPAGTDVIVNVTNAGTMEHDLKMQGETGADLIPPGETVEVSLGVVTETTQAWCTVPGHKAAGMVLDINLTGGQTSTGAAAGHASAEPDAGNSAEIDFNAAPGPDWQQFDPTLEPAPGGTEHELKFNATERETEVAPGVTQLMWTFNNQVPAPTLRGKVGDMFTITLTNNGTIGHSLDFHASKVAWDDEMRTIPPGESLIYQFKAKHAGVFMYHCGTEPVLHHIGNGMFGAIIIDPPDLPKVDHEFLFVQHELYLGAQGEPGDLTKMQEEDEDAIVFNGYVNQYQHAPVKVNPGERVRAFVFDAGPSENSSFHVIGTVFDTAYMEGAYRLRPDATRGGSQALGLQPAQGGFVEFTFDEAGMYPFITHKFTNAGKGALGFFQVGDADPSSVAAGH